MKKKKSWIWLIVVINHNHDHLCTINGPWGAHSGTTQPQESYDVYNDYPNQCVWYQNLRHALFSQILKLARDEILQSSWIHAHLPYISRKLVCALRCLYSDIKKLYANTCLWTRHYSTLWLSPISLFSIWHGSPPYLYGKILRRYKRS